MKLFSERYGHKPVRVEIQLDSMDAPLRNGLWDMYERHYLSNVRTDDIFEKGAFLHNNTHIANLMYNLWHHYWKEPIDTLEDNFDWAYGRIRSYFLKKAEWHEVYSFLEFCVQRYSLEVVNEDFKQECNKVLERELSGYRFIGSAIMPITSTTEIQTVEDGLASAKSMPEVFEHLKKAAELFSRRKDPDYPNSIKESMSAVEAVCRKITGNSGETLGAALNTIEKNKRIEFPGGLKAGLGSLWGYASNTGGIRHATDGATVPFEDSKLILVICAGLVPYLISKADKAQISLA